MAGFRYSVESLSEKNNTVGRMIRGTRDIFVDLVSKTFSFFSPQIEEVDRSNYILINKFPFGWFTKRVRRIYKTVKITNMYELLGIRMFGKSTIKLHKFFIPEMIYVLSQCGRGAPQGIISNLIENTWVKDLLTNDHKFVNGVSMSMIAQSMNVKLYPWQTEFIEEYDIKRQKAHLRGELLSFGCGLGKTITSLALMEAIGADCVVIIAPKSTLEDVWVDHLKRFYKHPQSYWLIGDPPKDAKFFIVNYESMPKLDSVMKFLRNKRKPAVIVDESHNFLHMNSARTQNLIKLRDDLNCDHMLLMSGTPVKSIGKEVIPLLRVIDGFFDDEAAVIFAKAFGINTLLGTDIIHSRLNLMMHRRRMEDVYELPQKNEVTMQVKIANGSKYTIDSVKNVLLEYMEERSKFHETNRPVYEDEWSECFKFISHELGNTRDFMRWIAIVNDLHDNGYNRFSKKCVEDSKWAKLYEKDTIIPILPRDLKVKFEHCISKIKYIGLVIKGEVLGKLEKLRANLTNELVSAIDIESIVNNSAKKVIFFTSYVQTVEKVSELLDSLGINYVKVYGATSSEATSLLDKFRKDQKVQVLIATVQTLATGVTLVEANTVVFCNQLYRSADLEQASNRVWRLGQDTECDIISLHLDTGTTPNLSDRTDEILKWSKELTDAMVDGK